jgi:CubicO group peptidase (beta-lactamase class C family)
MAESLLRSGYATLEHEIAQEKASALGRLGRRLEAALAALAACPRTATADRKIRDSLVEQAGYALWLFIGQREACGLNDSSQVMQDYAVPHEVNVRMGPLFTPRAPPIHRSPSVAIQAGAMGLSAALAERVDAVFADMDLRRHPGAALLVIDHGECLYCKCYGFADLETERPITADRSFYLASISKQFTAMAVMMLVEQGKLSFEDRLPAYFPRFPSWGAEITLRHMLHHTSGLPGYRHFMEPGDLIGVTNEDVLERVMGLAGPEFPAGTKYAYHDTAYTLLATIVANVSGRSFAEFLKANIFDPLDMKHSVAYDASPSARHKLVQGYLAENGKFERWDYPLLTVGDGGLFSTLDDLFL